MLILKIGGGAAIDYEAIATDLKEIHEPVVVVHGANALRNQLGRELGTPVTTVTSLSGQTSVFSDKNTLDLMMMAYAGLANKRLVAVFQKHGINAVGLSGLDGGLVRGRRNRGIKTMRNGKRMLVRDFSGKPVEVNSQLIHLLLEHGYTPVLTVPILDEEGAVINTENDDIVALLQQALGCDRVVQLIEAPGILADSKNPKSLIRKMGCTELTQLEKSADGRMRRKLLALMRLFESEGVRPVVYVGDGRRRRPIQRLLSGGGTCIR